MTAFTMILITVGNGVLWCCIWATALEGTPETIAVGQRWCCSAIATTKRFWLLTRYLRKPPLALGIPLFPCGSDLHRIFVPNENVKICYAAMSNGARHAEKQISDDRVFYEILSDYQFMELEGPDFYGGNLKHYIGQCGGRLLTAVISFRHC